MYSMKVLFTTVDMRVTAHSYMVVVSICHDMNSKKQCKELSVIKICTSFRNEAA